jgi:hypothetical protein
MGHFFRIPRFLFGMISQILIFGTATFLQPTLALTLQSFGYHAVFIGFSFALPTLLYAATSPFIFLLTSKYKRSGVIFFGYCFMAASMFLVGPSKILGFYNSPAIILLGISLLGFGIGTVIIPTMPEMIEVLERAFPHLDEDELTNHVTALCVSF